MPACRWRHCTARSSLLPAHARGARLDLAAALLEAAAARVEECRRRILPALAKVVALSRQEQHCMLSGAFQSSQRGSSSSAAASPDGGRSRITVRCALNSRA